MMFGFLKRKTSDGDWHFEKTIQQIVTWYSNGKPSQHSLDDTFYYHLYSLGDNRKCIEGDNRKCIEAWTNKNNNPNDFMKNKAKVNSIYASQIVCWLHGGPLPQGGGQGPDDRPRKTPPVAKPKTKKAAKSKKPVLETNVIDFASKKNAA